MHIAPIILPVVSVLLILSLQSCSQIDKRKKMCQRRTKNYDIQPEDEDFALLQKLEPVPYQSKQNTEKSYFPYAKFNFWVEPDEPVLRGRIPEEDVVEESVKEFRKYIESNLVLQMLNPHLLLAMKGVGEAIDGLLSTRLSHTIHPLTLWVLDDRTENLENTFDISKFSELLHHFEWIPELRDLSTSEQYDLLFYLFARLLSEARDSLELPVTADEEWVERGLRKGLKLLRDETFRDRLRAERIKLKPDPAHFLVEEESERERD